MGLVTATGTAAEAVPPATLREAVDTILILLAPFVPHVASELWEVAGHRDRVTAVPWPSPDAAALQQRTVELPVQINGKLRARLTVPADAGADEVLAAALADPRVRAVLAGRQVRKHVLVPGRMVRLVL